MFQYRVRNRNMSHLTVERLVALADEEPTSAEAAHLATCELCAKERNANRAVLALAGLERNYAGAPLTTWEQLAPRLREEGLIATGLRRLRFPSNRQWLEAAAAVLLIGGGAIIGRYSVGGTPLPGATVAMQQEGTPVLAASNPSAAQSFSSQEEAVAVLARAGREYQSALAYLASHDSTATGVDKSSMYRNRLATLDEVAETTRQAVKEAPYDPVINRYYMTTMSTREATLRQLGNSLPTGAKLTSF
jgi:hypothetical protein